MIGQQVGPYTIVAELGRGGFGTVYRALHGGLDRTVALKVLEPSLAIDDDIVRRFQREARLAAGLQHPHIVTVYDVGESDGVSYVAMRYVDGEELGRLLGREGPLDARRALHLVGQVGEALDYAHSRGVSHRDVKPSNVLVERNDVVTVTDFGMAGVAERTATTPAAIEVGNADYLSPEHARGDQVGPASDLYALGVLLYVALAGRPPFSAASTPALLYKHVHEPPPPLGAFRPDLPEGLSEVLNRALAKRPEERFASAGELLAAARAAAERPGFPLTATPDAAGFPRPDLVPGSAAGPDGPPDDERQIESPRDSDGALLPDENVQFTIYRPRVIRPRAWYPLLAFAHLAEPRPDAEANQPDPPEEVRRQARQMLGEQFEEFGDLTQDSLQAVPREGEITLVPRVPGIEFNPPAQSFRWVETVHRADFRLRASPETDGRTLRGHVTVFLGSILLADVALSIRVDSAYVPQATAAELEISYAQPYRKVFASYSHRDLQIVRQFEQYAATLGDRYLRDWIELRAGEVWSDRLERMIDEADVFQLFWSSSSMRSNYVRREWEYALALGRPSFVRPTYWESPLPSDPARGLPPSELSRLHFHRIGVVPSPRPAAPAASPLQPPPDERPTPRPFERPTGQWAPVSAPAGPPIESPYLPGIPPPAPRPATRRGLVALLLGAVAAVAVLVLIWMLVGGSR